MNFTREEAEAIFNLIQSSNGDVSEGNIAVLHKISKTYPAILAGTKYVKILADDTRKKEQNKIAATAKISGILEDIRAKMNQAVQIANGAGIGFEFDTAFGNSWYEPGEGWNSSNC
jgi:biotin-(acetyl-CoA carboxylase) ligase